MIACNTKVLSENKILVLIVDDERAICESLSSVLKDENFDTIVSYDGQDALSQVSKNSPEIVFLDMWMPGSDGMETLERIKQIAPDTEVIMISGHATITNALDAMKRGAFDFIEKPFAIESVIQTTFRALERRHRKFDKGEKTQAVDQDKLLDMRKDSLTFFSHPGINSKALGGRNFGQRTLRDSVILYGQCLHSGIKSGLVLEPLPANSGIHFAQMGASKTVPVFVDFVESTDFATTVRAGGTSVATIEHLMAVLHAYKISNLLIKCNGEVPIFDGSAAQFCKLIESVGLEEQGGDWYEIAIESTISVSDKSGKEMLSIEPASEFQVTYELNYPTPVGSQVHSFILKDKDSFRQEIAPARTFGFMKDVELLQRAGLAAGGRLDNFILIGTDKIVNTELRFPDELARHKVLDAIGDLFLIGRPIRGAVKAKMTGHSDNVQLVRAVRRLLSDIEA